jgi:hypothetical protein
MIDVRDDAEVADPVKTHASRRCLVLERDVAVVRGAQDLRKVG